MRKFLGNYVPSYAPTFDQQMSTISDDLKQQVRNKIENLTNDPFHNTKFMKGQHRYRRKARLNDSDRLAFVICEECRELGHVQYNRCSDCATTPENTIVIAYLILGHDY
jgi:hypothetical protein